MIRYSLLLLPLVVVALGCGSDRETAQVSGTARYSDGSMLEGAAIVIRLQPTQDSQATIIKAASGRIQPDGSFTMMTRKHGDGVICGKYNVTFSVLSDPNNPDSSLIHERYTGMGEPAFPPIEVTDDIDDLEFVLEKL